MSAALSIRNLTKVYNNKLEALKGISLDVMPGDFFAVLGPNGAGKSTTIGIISSLVRKTAGDVEIFGINIDTTSETYEISRTEAKSNEIVLYESGDTVTENTLFAAAGIADTTIIKYASATITTNSTYITW